MPETAAIPRPMPPASSRPVDRLNHVDWLRAVGIFLVVYGHSQGMPSPVYRVVYAFHMPLFFFLSGLTLKPSKCARPFREHFADTCRALLPPYLIFALIGYIAWLLVVRHYSSHTSADTPLYQPLAAIVYGSGTRNDLLQPMVLWFFPCLLVTQLLFWPMSRLPLLGRLAAGVASLAAGWALRDLVLPWELETAALALPFFWLGYEVGTRPTLLAFSRAASLGLGLAAAFVMGWLALQNSGVDLRKSDIGNPFLFVSSALLALFALFVLARQLPRNALAERVSRSTLVIFPLHPHAFWALAAGYALVLKQPALRQNPLVALLASLAITGALTWITPWVQPWIDRMREWFGGKRPARAAR